MVIGTERCHEYVGGLVEAQPVESTVIDQRTAAPSERKEAHESAANIPAPICPLVDRAVLRMARDRRFAPFFTHSQGVFCSRRA